MTEPTHSHSHADHAHAGPDLKLYLTIGVALAVFTVVSFVVNYEVRHKVFSPPTGFVIILTVAICKAVLVGMFFMHLKYDWGNLYFMLLPILILATMMMLVLMPDIVFAWHNDLINQIDKAPAIPHAGH
jgi:cytochrome c oxidase subunit 4